MIRRGGMKDEKLKHTEDFFDIYSTGTREIAFFGVAGAAGLTIAFFRKDKTGFVTDRPPQRGCAGRQWTEERQRLHFQRGGNVHGTR